MSVQAQSSPGWSIDSWRRFWSNPSVEVALKRVPTIVAPEVVAVWPRIPKEVRGPAAYAQRVADLLTLVPDLRLELAEHAAHGEFTFIRWAARGTGPNGRFEGIGTDRIRLQGGLVVENLIMSDLAIFEALARLVEGGGGRPANGPATLRP
ncbi:MAG: ester cyclase [Acetobacteraceae bacterium]|nr:ester cyclase [Acetobacteraceae bacterium]